MTPPAHIKRKLTWQDDQSSTSQTLSEGSSIAGIFHRLPVHDSLRFRVLGPNLRDFRVCALGWRFQYLSTKFPVLEEVRFACQCKACKI